jgi:hypothetical protein
MASVVTRFREVTGLSGIGDPIYARSAALGPVGVEDGVVCDCGEDLVSTVASTRSESHRIIPPGS